MKLISQTRKPLKSSSLLQCGWRFKPPKYRQARAAQRHPGTLDTAPHTAIGFESGFTPIGRGAKIPKEDWFHDDSPEFGGCNSILSDLGVRPNGDLLPCCSASATLPALHLGSLDDAEFMNLLSDAWKREVFRTLRTRGPAGLVGNLDTSKYVNRCHLCYEVVKDL